MGHITVNFDVFDAHGTRRRAMEPCGQLCNITAFNTDMVEISRGLAARFILHVDVALARKLTGKLLQNHAPILGCNNQARANDSIAPHNEAAHSQIQFPRKPWNIDGACGLLQEGLHGAFRRGHRRASLVRKQAIKIDLAGGKRKTTCPLSCEINIAIAA